MGVGEERGQTVDFRTLQNFTSTLQVFRTTLSADELTRRPDALLNVGAAEEVFDFVRQRSVFLDAEQGHVQST